MTALLLTAILRPRDDVKAKSPAVSDAIETSIKNVETAVNSSDKTKALDALKSFSSVVTSAAKS
jgi:ribosomal protein S20